MLLYMNGRRLALKTPPQRRMRPLVQWGYAIPMAGVKVYMRRTITAHARVRRRLRRPTSPRVYNSARHTVRYYARRRAKATPR